MAEITISVNGDPRVLEEGASVADLLATLGLDDRPVAVERNHHVVPRAEHQSTSLSDGDRLEVVGFVGGG